MRDFINMFHFARVATLFRFIYCRLTKETKYHRAVRVCNFFLDEGFAPIPSILLVPTFNSTMTFYLSSHFGKALAVTKNTYYLPTIKKMDLN